MQRRLIFSRIAACSMARRNAPHNDHSYREVVGGIIPGYAGHRPGAEAIHGESAVGGVPGTLQESHAPGQGWSVDRRDTTYFKELGADYKHHSLDKAEAFRQVVGGVKSGYHGHVPGAQNHIGSAHVGGVPLHDFTPTASRPQYYPGDPRWQTESSRQGPRGQVVYGDSLHLELPASGAGNGTGYTPPTTPPAVAHRTMRGPTPPPSQRRGGGGGGSPNGYAGPTPRGGQPPRRAMPPDQKMPAVGYAGHRMGERELTDESVRHQVEAYNNSGMGFRGPPAGALAGANKSTSSAVTPPPSNRTRPAIVGEQTVSPQQMQQVFNGQMRAAQPAGARTPPKQYLALSSVEPTDVDPFPSPAGAARPGHRQAFMQASRQQQAQHQAQQLTPSHSQRSTPRSEQVWQPPSWDQRRSTPQDEIYRNNVGGVKLGYSGHIPSREHNVGASNYGASNFDHISQRDHGTRMYSDAVQPNHMITGKASASAVGYQGHHPTNQQTVGTSYWQAAAGGAEPRFARRSGDMRDLLSA